MPTVSEILGYVDRKYPNRETVANKVADLDMIHKDVFKRIRRLSNDFSIYEDISVDGQVFYRLPPNCRIEDIVRIDVETGVGVDSFDTFEYAGVKDEIAGRKVFLRGENETFALFDNEEPLRVSVRRIMIYYYPRPTTLNDLDLTVAPDLDEDYHDVLKFSLISELASQGHNPDTEIADFWRKRADEQLAVIEAALAERIDNARTKTAECDEHW